MKFFDLNAFNDWRKRGFKGVSEIRVMSGKPVKPFIATDKCRICSFYVDGDNCCLKNKKHPEKCSVPLRFTAICPKCHIVKTGKRQWGENFIKFQCTNLIAGKWLCDCRFSLTFRTGDSEKEKSKQRWLAGGEDDEHWTDFTIRKF